MKIILKDGTAINCEDGYALRLIEQGRATFAPEAPKPARARAKRQEEAVKHEPEGEDRG